MKTQASCGRGCTAEAIDPARPQCRKHHALYVRDAHRGDHAPLLGHTLDNKYHLVALLGVGSHATVYWGIRAKLGHFVAVKVLRSEPTERDTLRRFRAQSKVLAHLHNEHIVGVEFAGTGFHRDLAEGRRSASRRLLYIVTQHVLGPNIEQAQIGPTSPSQAIHIAQQIISALRTAHAEGILHRDLKPRNVMLVPDQGGPPQVKVLDFGIARVLSGDSNLDHESKLLGDPRYLAPEQLNNEPLSPATDLYSVATLIYELIEGRPLFDAQTPHALMALRLSAEPPKLPNTWPPALAAVIRRALQRAPEARYATAAELAAALEALGPVLDASPSLPIQAPDPDSPPERIAPKSSDVFDPFIELDPPAAHPGSGLAARARNLESAPVFLPALSDEDPFVDTKNPAPIDPPTDQSEPQSPRSTQPLVVRFAEPQPARETQPLILPLTQPEPEAAPPPKRRASTLRWALLALIALGVLIWALSGPSSTAPTSVDTAATEVRVGAMSPLDAAVVDMVADPKVKDAAPLDAAVTQDTATPLDAARDTAPLDAAATQDTATRDTMSPSPDHCASARADYRESLLDVSGLGLRGQRAALAACAACVGEHSDAPCARLYARTKKCVYAAIRIEKHAKSATWSALSSLTRKAKRCRFWCEGDPPADDHWDALCATVARCAEAATHRVGPACARACKGAPKALKKLCK